MLQIQEDQPHRPAPAAGVAARGSTAALELLRYTTEDRLPLNALLWSPPVLARSAVVLVPGSNGNIVAGVHDYRPLAEQVDALSYALLLSDMRTASDFTDPRFEDCVADIAAAMAAVRERGYADVALFGTSLGGPRAAYYLQRPATAR